MRSAAILVIPQIAAVPPALCDQRVAKSPYFGQSPIPFARPDIEPNSQRRPSCGIAETIEWYVSNRPWWEAIRSGEFRHYYERMYGAR